MCVYSIARGYPGHQTPYISNRHICVHYEALVYVISISQYVRLSVFVLVSEAFSINAKLYNHCQCCICTAGQIKEINNEEIVRKGKGGRERERERERERKRERRKGKKEEKRMKNKEEPQERQ